MNRNTLKAFLVGAAGLAGLAGMGAGAFARADTAGDPAPASLSADSVRAVVAEMLADAETRASLLAGGGGEAGHDGRFFIAGDGFRLNVGGQVQFRYLANFRDDLNVDKDQFGFQARRTRLILDGKINKDWDFGIIGEFSRAGDGMELLDGWAQYSFPGGLKVKWGQFKVPLLREELVSDGRQLAVERSLTNSAYTQSRSQGVQVGYYADSWRAMAAFNDGLNSRNTDFTGSDEDTGIFKVAGEADWAATGRAEVLLAGEFKRFDEFTSARGSELGVMLGAAAHYQQSPNTNRPFGGAGPIDVDRNTLEYTADVSVKADGWNLYGAFIGRHTERRAGGAGGGGTDFDDFGAIAQAGVYIAEHVEVFGRWDAIFIDGDRFAGAGPNDFHFLTAGFNIYFAGHALKWTSDVVWSFNKTDRLVSLGVLKDTGVGLLGDAKENEVTIRSQFNLLF